MKINGMVVSTAATMAATALLAGLPGAASASTAFTYYEFIETGSFFGSAEFIYQSADLLTADATVTPQSCYVSGGKTCAGASFDLSPNSFGGTDDEISFSYNNVVASSGGGTGFYFFQPGALSNYGTYTDAGYPMNTPGYGNAGFATLTVSSTAPAPLIPFPAVPEPSTWFLMIAGIGGVGAVMRRSRKAGDALAA